MRVLRLLPLLVVITLVACDNSYQNIPPNDIGMLLTPTGYEEHIYTPGQVNIRDQDISGQGNSLVLIQRSGLQIKEQFVGPDASTDKEDHRCLTADKAPMTIDVRMLFALPDYTTPDGEKELARVFMLGNPVATENGGGRILRITAESIYSEQAQQQVRSRVRQICANYASFDAAYAAFADENSKQGLNTLVANAVGTVLKEQNVPLRLVSASISNLKPDPTVVTAIASKEAADQRIKAIRTITDFLDEDPSGTRRLVYRMQVLQEIVAKAGTTGHNTIFMTDVNNETTKVVPLPGSR